MTGALFESVFLRGFFGSMLQQVDASTVQLLLWMA